MSHDLIDGNYYITSGGKIPVKWTAPEVLINLVLHDLSMCIYNCIGTTLQEILSSE